MSVSKNICEEYFNGRVNLCQAKSRIKILQVEETAGDNAKAKRRMIVYAYSDTILWTLKLVNVKINI